MKLHRYEIRPRKDQRGVDLISEELPFVSLWYGEPGAIENAIGYASHNSRSHETEVRIYDQRGALVKAHRWNPRIKE